MKTLATALLFGLGALITTWAGTLAEQYSGQGLLIVTQLVSAPFPHPQRAAGHQYKDQFFPAREHYSDSTVAIFIPKGFRETGQVDFVVHFHGWKNNVAGVLQGYGLLEQFMDSRRNAVLVVPQGPRSASDSFGGKLEDPDGFKRFMEEVVPVLRSTPGALQKNFQVRNIILSGHSGGYAVISSILNCGGLSKQVKEVWLFDALYGRTEKFLAWSDMVHGRWLNIYTDGGGTKEETQTLMAALRKRGTTYISLEETSFKPDELRFRGPVFLHTTLEHNDVLQKHRTFLEFLSTSLLEER